MKRGLRAGIDVGGTKIAVGTVRDDGQVTALEAFPTPQEPDVVVRQICDTLVRLLHRQGKTPADLAAVGLAFPADLDLATGQVITAPNLPAFVGLRPGDQLSRELQLRFGQTVPMAVNNDTCAAVLAEARFGAGRGIERMLYLTVSTGLGGARYDGVRPINIEPGLRNFPDPKHPHVCLEDLASGAALARRARLSIREALTSGAPLLELTKVLTLKDLAHRPLEEALARLSTRHLAEAAELGDPLSSILLADSARLTAASLKQLLLQGFGEERIIVGGSVALKTKGYLDRLRAELAQAFEVAGDRPPLDPAKDLAAAALGDERGVIGAALLTDEDTVVALHATRLA